MKPVCKPYSRPWSLGRTQVNFGLINSRSADSNPPVILLQILYVPIWITNYQSPPITPYPSSVRPLVGLHIPD